jgi:hypothetical protein
MLIYFAGSASKNKGIQKEIYGGGNILNHLTTFADLPEIKTKLDCMFLHLTDTTARIQGNLSCKELMAEGNYTNSLYSYAYPNQEEQWKSYYNMLIHLAETSSERGQYQSLIDTEFPSHLMSFAYKNNCLSEFIKVWSMLIFLAGNKSTECPDLIRTQIEQDTLMSYEDKTKIEHKMNVFLAGHSATNSTEIVRKDHENHLTTFANQQEVSNKFDTCVNDRLLPRILIDSGAFTAFTTGKVIKLEEYGEWALNFKKQWESKVRSLEFFNLDVIGSQEKSNINLHRLEKMGLQTIPIFTYKADIKHLEYYLRNYEYIGLGGLVGRPAKEIQQWLDYCFKYIIKYKKETGILRKIHLLGVTKQEFLERYPCYSCDSSGWVACLRFGGGRAIGKNKIPKYTESPEALKVTIATLRAEIKKYKKRQDDVTKLWAKRGVIWDD